MRIGFVLQDASRAPSGLDSYTANLWQALSSLDTGHECVPVTLPARVAGRAHLRTLWEQTYLPLWAARADVDVLHVPAGSAPLLRDRPCVLTLHDLGAGAAPAYPTPAGPRLYFGRIVPWSARGATALIADSEATKRDAVARLGIDRKRITVVHLAPSPSYRPLPAEKVATVLEKYGLCEPYFLQVGAVIPRKNVPGATEGFARFLTRRPGPGATLVIAGGRGFGALALPPNGEELVRTGRVRLLGHLPQDDLVALYNGALAVVLPSFFEGFGLPLVEAFACGTPAIASSVASLPEVAGDAAVYVDPGDPATIAAAMERYTSADFRAEMAGRAGERSRAFSWRRAAGQTVAVYEQAAGKSPRPRSRARGEGDTRPKVLFVRLDALGDLVLTTPCFEALKRRYPGCELHVAVQPVTEPLIASDPRVDRVHVLAAPWHSSSGWRPGAIKETLDLLHRLRAERFDYVITLRRDLDDALFAHLCGGRETLGFHARRTRPLLSRAARFQPGRHMVENHLHLMKLLGCDVEGARPDVRCSAGDSGAARLLTSEAPVAIAPFASSQNKTLDAARIASLIDALAAETGRPVALLGAPVDRRSADQALARTSRTVIDLVGRTSVPELCDVLRRCRLLVCVDSAPMHLAAALGTPLVALFGGEDSSLWGPYGDTPSRILHGRDLDGLPSVVEIEPRQVIHAVRDLLAPTAAPQAAREEVAA
jgi:ADP-heptose:LPS heptosyltransferase/glycosyltransferase involved in cell wall biosynthesis